MPHPMERRLLSSGSFGELQSEADGCELDWPFGVLDAIDRDELRETAYEIFFTSCRSAPGFAGRSALNLAPEEERATASSKPEKAAPGGRGTQMVVKSRIKQSVGLRTRGARTMTQMGSAAVGGGGARPVSPVKVKRPMTSAEIMRQQMGVTEQSDHRLRKTLARSLVGQMNKRTETIVLPLELLRHVKPAEFNDALEYYQWQRRQLKMLEAGLLLHPWVPVDQKNDAAVRLREIVRSTEFKPMDTSKNSEAMRALDSCVRTLAWRNPTNNSRMEACHWADGYPLNVHIYLSLLGSIFDLRDETVVLDEVDELVELMKKTWATLGINRMIHTMCFTWVLFEQYVMTGQVEPDLITATLAMLVEVAGDAKRPDREPGYVRVLSATLASMQGWAERKLLDYQEGFQDGAVGMMENVLCLALSTLKITTEDISSNGSSPMLVERRNNNAPIRSPSENRVDRYIKSSMKNAFTRIFENGNGRADSMVVEVDEDPSETLMQLISQIEKLAMVEKETYSPILQKWHPSPTAVALVTLHNCFGIVLKQYISRTSGLTNELVRVLQSVAKLEKMLVQMVVEDATERGDGGKGVVKEMVPYEVDSITLNLMRTWIEERLKLGRQRVNRAKENENWNPKSKTEPYAQSAVDLMKLAKLTADEFCEIQVGGRDELVPVLADGLESLVLEYVSLVASCGTKETYVPALPSLTRCNQDSKLLEFWKKAFANCHAGMDPGPTTPVQPGVSGDKPNKHGSSTSRGTQRLYVRLNTLHYILSLLHSIDKSLSFFSRTGHSPSPRRTPLGNHQCRRRVISPAHFDLCRTAIQAAILQVSEIAAYRLIFADSAATFYNSLYVHSVAASRIRPTLRALKQNLGLLAAVLTERAQPGAVREIMKASFECFLTVLLAGGTARAFKREDYEMVTEDFGSLKRVFCTSGEGLVAEEVVEKEAAAVQAVVALMGLPTEQLVEDFSMMACKGGEFEGGRRVPLPPATGKWSQSDPNTVVRVLCHRDDDVADLFLKKTFQLPKRR